MLRTSSHRLVAEELEDAEMEDAAGKGEAVEEHLEGLVEIGASSIAHIAIGLATLWLHATTSIRNLLQAFLDHVLVWPSHCCKRARNPTESRANIRLTRLGGEGTRGRGEEGNRNIVTARE
jgi:hypothetical protein